MLDIVMHNVIIFLLVNPPLSACERRSCLSRLSDWLHTGSIQFDKSDRKRQWHRYANGKTLEQNASIKQVEFWTKFSMQPKDEMVTKDCGFNQPETVSRLRMNDDTHSPCLLGRRW